MKSVHTVGYFYIHICFKPRFMFIIIIWSWLSANSKIHEMTSTPCVTNQLGANAEGNGLPVPSGVETGSLLSLFTANQLLIRGHQPSLFSLNCIKCIWPFAMEIVHLTKLWTEALAIFLNILIKPLDDIAMPLYFNSCNDKVENFPFLSCNFKHFSAVMVSP